MVTGLFDLVGATADLLNSVLGGEDAFPALFGDDSYGEGEGTLGKRGFGSVAVEPGNLPGYPASHEPRNWLRVSAVINCEVFGVPVKPGCLTEALSSLRTKAADPTSARDLAAKVPALIEAQRAIAAVRDLLPQGGGTGAADEGADKPGGSKGAGKGNGTVPGGHGGKGGGDGSDGGGSGGAGSGGAGSGGGQGSGGGAGSGSGGGSGSPLDKLDGLGLGDKLEGLGLGGKGKPKGGGLLGGLGKGLGLGRRDAGGAASRPYSDLMGFLLG